MSYFVYTLRSCRDGTYYAGSTQDLNKIIERHNQGRSKCTKAKRPWELVCFEEHTDSSSAVRREKGVKSRKKETYILRPLFKCFSKETHHFSTD